MTEEGHIPVRTCVGCRKKKKKEEMVWLAQRPEGMVVVDAKKPHRGRGVYLCRDDECLRMARKRKKGFEFFGPTDFQFFSAKGFSAQEVGNGKE